MEDSKRSVIKFLILVAIVTVLLWFNSALISYVRTLLSCPQSNKTNTSSTQQKIRQSTHRKQFIIFEKIEVKDIMYVENDWEVKEHVDSELSPQCSNIKNEDKFDCDPVGGISQANCESRGCCWKPVLRKSVNKSVELFPPLGVPWCYYPKKFKGYQVDKVYNTDLGFNADLSRNTQSPYPETVMDIRVEVRYETESRLRIKVWS